MSKPNTFRPWLPGQISLLSPSPSDWLSDDHQVYFLLDLVDDLDLSTILTPARAKDPRGEKGVDCCEQNKGKICSVSSHRRE